jgi:predicted nucleic acid-binding protein
MIILDTNVLSELFRPVPATQVEAWMSSLPGDTVFFTTVGEAELKSGVAVLPEGKRRTRLSEAIDCVLEEDLRGRVLPFGRDAAHSYSIIAAERRAAGRPIGQFDCQIAAIARSHGGTLATRNTSDFEGCGVPLINPWDWEAPA